MKFGSLLKKELGGLLTVQALMSMAITCVLLISMGQLTSSAMDSGTNASEINICDMDRSEYTAELIKHLEEYGSKPSLYELQSDNYAAELERLGIKSIVIIPEGFGNSVTADKKPAELKYASVLGMGMTGTMSSMGAADAITAIDGYVRDSILRDSHNMSEEEAERVKNPLITVEYTAMNGRTAKASGVMLSSVIMSQTMIAPMAIFFMLIMAAQMIMTAISAEKIDKTLETLLSAPVPRITILTAKMTAAFIVALLNAIVMMIGFIGYMIGMLGSSGGEIMMSMGASSVSVSSGDAMSSVQAMSELGMNIGIGGYLLMGLQILASITIGLALALILGALCEDAQSTNTLLMPIMITTMIPFFAVMFFDMREMGFAAKLLLYIIPFTHSYIALTNLMTGNTAIFWGGFAYQIVFLAVCMFFAVKMFTTDKIFTMTGAVSQKMKNKKK